MYKKTNVLIIFLAMSLTFASLQAQVQKINGVGQRPETLQSLAQQFVAPADNYKPHVWWHWLGSNFSKAGMTKDLQAMKEAGIGGVVVFNAPSWLNPEQNPWPQQTYRSEAYWDALGHALSEAKRLNMTVGIHNSPGWSTTGGPWITPEQGMQAAAFSTTKVEGAKQVSIELPNPKAGQETAVYFRDIAVIAVPAGNGVYPDSMLDISENFSNGVLKWQAPAGEWTIYRFGHYPTMQRTHPTPEDVTDISFEADKMSVEATVKHWNNVLNPFKDKFSEYIGNTFQDIWIDSYEAWWQSWSPNFRKDFIRIKGYDPVTQIILAYERGDSILNEKTHGIHDAGRRFSVESRTFLRDYAEVINRLFLECWQTGKRMVNEAGFRLCFEPYGSIVGAPFDMNAGIGIADIPVTEFWVHSWDISGDEAFAGAAAEHGKRIVGAEAFTGMEATCQFTEAPYMLKRPADMGYSFGVNQYYLHSWAHNPLDDKYQPGFGFAHYGTHFSRNQTWFEPGKAFFTYLARCQMLLQQGSFITRSNEILHRRTPDAEIFFIRNTGDAQEKNLELPVSGRVPELWDAYTGVIKNTSRWKQNENSTSLTLPMEKEESVFVVFPAQKTAYAKLPETQVQKETASGIDGKWTVYFKPKTDEKPFQRKFAKLADFSKQDDAAVKYFSGTATYEKTVRINSADLSANKAVVIDLGELYDIAELEVNGKKAGVLWCPPYRTNITHLLKPGNNTVKIHITNNWANRLIGDEQYPEDFEWTDRNQGLRAMAGFPEWFLKDRPRPVKERKTFVPWYYFDKNSPLFPAGLLGPVKLLKQDIISIGD